jgi:hypothetical protein
MSVNYRTNYWLLGDGADEEAKRWAGDGKHKKIVYSSPKHGPQRQREHST